MDNKQTIVANVYTDGSGIGQIRKDFTQDTWEAGITLQLNNLTTIPGFQSSKAVVDALSRSGRATLIVPTQPYATTTEPVESTEWLKRSSNWKDATRTDAPPLYCADGPVENRDRTGTPVPLGGQKGSGRGSIPSSISHRKTTSKPAPSIPYAEPRRRNDLYTAVCGAAKSS